MVHNEVLWKKWFYKDGDWCNLLISFMRDDVMFKNFAT